MTAGITQSTQPQESKTTGSVNDSVEVNRSGCQLRRVRQGAGLRPQHLALAPPYQAALEPEHPDRPRGRERDPEARQRLHLVHQGGQGRALERGRQAVVKDRTPRRFEKPQVSPYGADLRFLVFRKR